MFLVEPTIHRVARALRAASVRTPSVGPLAEARARAAEQALAAVADRAGALRASLLAGDPEARRALATLAEDTLSRMRAEVSAQARGPIARLSADLDARFRDTDEGEWLDDPSFDRDARVRVLEHLDRLNTTAGSYRAFFETMRPFFRGDGAPTRVLDLAAGHGGFALEAARIARDEGIVLELAATDLVREYLDLGEAVARREGLPVRFALQDALDLSNLEAGSYDVIVCTQSLHHFPPGLVAVLASEASRIAARGVVLIDGYRSRTHAVLVGALGLFHYRDRAFAHDAWVSFRRFFSPEELGLLARLGPRGDRVHASWAAPTHCHVTIDRR